MENKTRKVITEPPKIEPKNIFERSIGNLVRRVFQPVLALGGTSALAAIATKILIATMSHNFGPPAIQSQIALIQTEINKIRGRQKTAEEKWKSVPIIRDVPIIRRGVGAVDEWLNRPEDLAKSVNILEGKLKTLEGLKQGAEFSGKYIEYYAERLSFLILFLVLLGPVSRRIEKILERSRTKSDDQHIANSANTAVKHTHENALILQGRIAELEKEVLQLLKEKPTDQPDISVDTSNLKSLIDKLALITKEIPEEKK